MASEEAIQVEDQTQQDLTDVESATTLDDSSITQLPFSCTETEYGFDNATESLFRDLLDSQFPADTGVANADKNIKEWMSRISKMDGESQSCSLETQSDDEFNGLSDQDKEKAAAHLVDSIKMQTFDPAKCMEDEQKVPSAKCNVLDEVKIQPGLVLMNCIRILCSEDKSENVYTDILKLASSEIPQSSSSETKIDFDTLEKSRGYFAKMRLNLKRVTHKKQTLVEAVQNYVSIEIDKAVEAKNVILFTRYSMIPEIVEKCNYEKSLNFTPDQIAKYGIVLQRAVHQEIVARCVDFLGDIGYILIPKDSDYEEDKLNLSCTDSHTWSLSQGMSSQGSEINIEMDRGNPPSQGNELENHDDGVDNPHNHLHNVNSPASSLEEYARGNSQASGSSFDSQRSYSMYDNATPPLPSLPEEEPPPVDFYDAEDEDEDDDDQEFGMEEIVDLHDITVWLPENEPEDNGSQSSYESDEPRRRRRRLE